MGPRAHRHFHDLHVALISGSFDALRVKMAPRTPSHLPTYVCRACRHQLRRQIQRPFASSSSPEVYDVVAVGGGPVGLALLAALSQFSCQPRRWMLTCSNRIVPGHIPS